MYVCMCLCVLEAILNTLECIPTGWNVLHQFCDQCKRLKCLLVRKHVWFELHVCEYILLVVRIFLE